MEAVRALEGMMRANRKANPRQERQARKQKVQGLESQEKWLRNFNALL